MTLPVKVCGITRLEDARAALECGAQALGFIFYPPSPRYLAPEEARRLIQQLPPFVVTVGVFVREVAEEINRISALCRLDRIQLHGGEPLEIINELDRPAYRAFRLKDESDLAAVKAAPDDIVLLDTFDPKIFGGTGRPFNWEWARRLGEEQLGDGQLREGQSGAGPTGDTAREVTRKVILAGGLTPDNISRALEIASPSAVDVSSGVEASPGIKDAAKIAAFFQAIKGHVFPTPSPWSAEHASP